MEQQFQPNNPTNQTGPSGPTVSVLKERLFPEDAITILRNENPGELTHSYSAERYNSRAEPIHFDKACELLASLRADVSSWYQKSFGKEFNPFHLGQRIDETRLQFYQDPRFREACQILDISPEDTDKITLPWWSVKGVAERSFDPENSHAELVPRHSYETQLMRAGVDLPIRNVSVASLPITAPDAEHPNGQLMIGLRAGASFAGSYHMFAGALQASPELIAGEKSIYDVFQETEFRNELCLDRALIERVSLHAHLHETAIENGAYYLFKLQTTLSAQKLEEQWRMNPNIDRDEHARPIFVGVDQESVRTFLNDYYRGLVADRPARGPEEQFVLHPTALALISLVGLPVSEARELIQDGYS